MEAALGAYLTALKDTRLCEKKRTNRGEREAGFQHRKRECPESGFIAGKRPTAVRTRQNQ